MSAFSRTPVHPSTRTRVRRRAALVVLTLAASLSVLAAPPTPAGAQAGDVGVEDGPFVEVGNPTESKAESKVWFHDGSWWSVQVTQDGTTMAGAPVGSSFIYRLDDATETWVKGAKIEKRGTAKSDVVVAGDNLYIATHKSDRNAGVSEPSASNHTLLFRFAYSGGTYTSSGPAVTMSTFEMKSMTIDRTPSGQLWAAWVMGDGAATPTYQVYTQSSTDDGATWSTPEALPFPTAITRQFDIASIAAFGNQVGVMWSKHQLPTTPTDGFYFTTHAANPATGTFSAAETAYAGAGVGDDHVNLKAFDGKVYAAVKTSNDTGSNPLIVLLQRAANGTWTRRTAWAGRTNVTRPLLQINETTGTARLWATGPVVAGLKGEDGGAIFTKSVPLDSGAFDANAAGDPAMLRSSSMINDVTGSKLPVSNATGTVVLASDKVITSTYWHSRIPAVVTPTIPPGNEYIAITPCRVADTRIPSAGGPLVMDQPRTFQIKGSGAGFAMQGGRANGCAIPAGATAVEASVTATAPGGTGFFRAWPTGTAPPQATFVNFIKAQGITNTGSLSLGSGPRELSAQNYGAPTDYVIDIQGYFVAPGTTDAKVYVPLTPCRVVDTRSAGAGGALSANEQRNFQISGSGATFAAQGGKGGGCAIPAGAKAVEAAVTATQPTGNGFFRAWPEGEQPPNATFANFTKGQGTTNTGAITLGALGTDGKDLSVKNYGGTTHYVIDVQGYYIDINAVPSDRTAVRYVPGNPCRLVDTRSTGAGGPAGDRELRRYVIGGSGSAIAGQGGKAGGCNVPVGAAAIEASVTAITPTADGFFRAWPNGAAEPTATILNFTKGQGTTNTGATSLATTAPELATRNFGGSANYVVDVQGYFVAAPPA